LLRRVEQDRALLRERFGAAGALCEIETGLSDRHADGRTVARLRFAEGPNIVYKPRSVAIEAAWSALLSWLSENGGEPPPAPRVLERAGYGFVEFLEPCELAGAREARDYFRKAGALLCLAWVAGLDDLHRENVIATRGGPALIDTETALQPQFASESGPGSGAMARAAGRWNRSFLRSGLLTTLKLDAAGRPVEIGGLRGRGGHPIAAKARRFSSPNTDAMELVWETAAAAATRNLPTLGGDPLFPDDFSEEAVDGFSSMYRFLLERREAVAAPGGPLDPFAGAECRLVVRPSAVYAGLLLELSAPGFLRDGLTRSFAIDSLSRIFRFERERPALWLLTRQEQGALERLDLPRFSVDPASRSIRAGTDEEIGGRIARSGLEAARDRLALLCPEDLAAQRALLEDELSAASASGQVGRPRTGRRPAGFSGRSFRRTAEDIGEEIRSQASEQAGGALTWKTPAAEGERGGEPGVAHGLYAGASGIVVFFAALGAVSGSREPFGIARAAALPIAAALDSSPPPHAGPAELIGACNGLGSLVYALVTAGKLASDPWYFEVAARAASRITRETIDGDNELDVESGAAGAILGLLALETVAPDSGALERAVLCGEHLLSLRREMGDGLWGWPSRGGLCLAGFAHGAAGIALALGRLSRPAGRPDFGRAALSACRYESTLYDPGHENWPVLSAKRPGQERIVMTAWCHGAPGIAISRAGLSGALGEGEVASDLARALAATRKAGPLGTDHLCCGNAGLVEALLVCGETFARTDWIDEAQSRASVLLQGAIERGGFRFRLEDPGPPSEPDPGFFRGLAGVGYTLLRVAVPATLPSVLCFADAAGFRPPA
ncbi:MAG TPA: type 2 lanthipeptide synthetase LanM family protein, partial [Thermoanaerobaculia bacterium]|nr:type 2 lanthipeptide synthetase LanM family protein [Thermoanaerobaculia bacterium]